jgi:hypothetical protein
VDSPETLKPETEGEVALAAAIDKVVDAMVAPEPASSFNIYELLSLFTFGLDRIKPADEERWRLAFSIAASTGGVFALRTGPKIEYLAVFWRTKNPHVNIAREIPKPDPGGNYAYIGWQWNESKIGVKALRKLEAHIARVSVGVEFIAGHDNRARLKKARRGKLIVVKVPEGHGALAHALFAGRNGR